MFTNRVVWITGASSGIGEALAARFARENARVVLSARRQPELERVRQRCIDAGAAPENMLVLPLDVTDLPSLPVAADHVISHFGQIDLLNIADPEGVALEGFRPEDGAFTFPFFTIEDVARVDETHIMVANDNNLP